MGKYHKSILKSATNVKPLQTSTDEEVYFQTVWFYFQTLYFQTLLLSNPISNHRELALSESSEFSEYSEFSDNSEFSEYSE